MQRCDLTHRVKTKLYRIASHDASQHIVAELKLRGRIDFNRSRAENALNLIRHVLVCEEISQEAKLCLRYCMDVLQSSPDQMHIPEALLQENPEGSNMGDVSFVEISAGLITPNQSSASCTRDYASSKDDCINFDGIRIEDLGLSVQDWLLSQFSHTAPQKHSSKHGQVRPLFAATPWPRRVLGPEYAPYSRTSLAGKCPEATANHDMSRDIIRPLNSHCSVCFQSHFSFPFLTMIAAIFPS